ncbi:hypothetical protein EHQ46_01290 [Leptospira yanagawae]|uniref:SH3b domain-containing protein n=1 Tax=Leptospira yanagawae TaxID=293069 RepID=A0ABY2M5B8_9LEPT|nr:SH3 domain-containing protein [Leptospira yanagawae]TGL23791.1 hypothetical protein EHQ46_01290 [Leptospira yanagawae]
MKKSLIRFEWIFTYFLVLSFCIWNCSTGKDGKSIANKNSNIGYITAKSGLFLRENPGKKFPKVTLVPHGEKVNILEYANTTDFIDGIEAKWVKAKYKNLEGWMFSGYLSDTPFAHSVSSSIADITYFQDDTYDIDTELKSRCPIQNDILCILNTAISYSNSNYYKKSIAANSKALALDPKNYIGLNNRGFGYLVIKELDKSLDDLNLSIEYRPTYNAYYLRSRIHLERKQYEKVSADLNQALQLNAQDCISYSLLGWNYLLLEKWELAKSTLMKSIDCDPSDSYSYANLANYYWKAKRDKKNALAFIEKSLQHGYTDYASFYKEDSDGKFLKGLSQTDEFNQLIDRYRKKK